MKYKTPVVVKIEPPKGLAHPTVPYDGILPWHEFSMGMIAPKGSGKTTLICNFILHFYKNYFNQIYIFSPTLHNDEKWGVVERKKFVLAKNTRYLQFLKYVLRKKEKEVFVQLLANGQDQSKAVIERQIHLLKKFNQSDRQIPKACFMVEYSKETLQDIVDARQAQIDFIQENLPEEKKYEAKYYADRCLLIFDDLVGSNLFSNSVHDNPFKGLNTRHRHFSTSLLIVSQAYKELPKTIRTNLTGWVFFKISNQKELEVIYEENPCGLTKDEWMKLYHHATEEPHSFLYINHYFTEKQGKLYKNFTNRLFYSSGLTLSNNPIKKK